MKLIRQSLASILALFLASAALAQSNQPPPKMVIETLNHDFGEVKAGVPLVHVFKLKNEGKGDLLIKNVSPG
jgi:hypothetical protein